MLSDSLKITELFMKINIHTKLLKKPVQNQLVPSKFQVSLVFKFVMIQQRPFKPDPSLLPLMLPTGHHINQVFSVTVLNNLTTVSHQSVLLVETGKLKTHGEHHGENQDSLDSNKETLVVSVTLPHIQTNDQLHINIIILILFINLLNTLII